MSIADIERMDTAECLRTMEALWDALYREPTEPESPDWHKGLLKERRRKIESGEAPSGKHPSDSGATETSVSRG